MKRIVHKGFFLILFILQTVTVLGQNYMIPADRIHYLTDAEDTLTAQDILSHKDELNFQSGSSETEVLKVRKSDVPYWVVFSLAQEELKDRLQTLEVVDSHIDEVKAHLQVGDTLISYQNAGHRLNFDQRPIPHKNFIYTLPHFAHDQDSVTFIMRIRSTKPSPFLFKLRSVNYNFEYATTEYITLGLFYGILLLLAFYNLTLYFFVKDKKYLYFVLYVVSCLVMATYEDGLGFQYLWPETPFINWILAVTNLPFYLLALLMYAKQFLEIDKVASRIKWGLYISFIVYSLLYIISYFLYPLGSFGFYTFMVPYTILFIITIYTLNKKKYSSILFLAGYVLSLIGIMQKVGIFSSDSIFLVYSFNIGMVIQVIFFSLALGQNFRQYKEEKEKAQQNIIRQLKENERIISQKVKERTLEVEQQKQVIEQTNEALRLANEKLQQRSAQIEYMNKLLNKEKEELEEDVVELTRARIMLREVNFTEFTKLFPNEDSCYHYLSELKWKNGYRCKKCDNDKYAKGQGHCARRCTKCGYNESATAYTIFHRLHFSVLKAFYLLFLVYSNKGEITTQQLSDTLDLRANTCWRYARKIKEKMKVHKGSPEEETDGWASMILE